jgi:hypothetical protein
MMYIEKKEVGPSSNVVLYLDQLTEAGENRGKILNFNTNTKNRKDLSKLRQ